MRRSTTRARSGDFLRQDDRTGFTIWNSDAVKEWNGLVVHKDQWEARHPQDLIRAPRERFGVPNPRLQPSLANTNFFGPLTTTVTAPATGDNEQMAPMGALGEFAIGQTSETDTAYNQPGSTILSVESTAGINAYDRLGILLESGDQFQTLVFSVASPTSIILLEPLPGAAKVGSVVTDYDVTT